MKELNKFIALSMVLVSLSSSALAQDIKPARQKGISVHVTPQSVVKLGQNSPVVQRFIISIYESSQPKRFYAPNALSAIETINKFDENRRLNGVWIVLTNPDSYDDEDRTEIIDLKQKLTEEGIVIFQTRAMNLPDGWEKV